MLYYQKGAGHEPGGERRSVTKKQGDENSVEHLKSLSQDQAVRFQEEAREKFYRDFVVGKATAIKRSMREGMEKGLRKGMEKGRLEERRQVALSMLQENADIDFILV